MILSTDPPLHLTYCLNIHPGQTWSENFAAIADKALAVRQAVAPGRRFGLGLRLSNEAAEELAQPAKLDSFGRFLQDHDLYVFTINGFPYGRFHGEPVKEDVYRPDWRTRERRDYTIRLIDILAALLPEGVSGSISTVPGAYKPWIRTADDVKQMCRMLAAAAAHAAAVLSETGRDVCIALEPEPDCFIENTGEAIAFFTETLPAEVGGAEATRHLGLCFDTAHAAVEFEEPAAALGRLVDAGVRVGKVQLSSALSLRPTAEALRRLGDFADPVYLHQVKLRLADGRIESYADLPAALAAAESAPAADTQLRVHFHVPLFFTQAGSLASTSSLLDEGFWRFAAGGAVEHLEIETYTFDVLPDDLRPPDVVESIRREFEWVLGRIAAAESD